MCFPSTLRFPSALAILSLFAGCINAHNNATRDDLPPDWQSAIASAAATPQSFVGFYSNRGQLITKGWDASHSTSPTKAVYTLRHGDAWLARWVSSGQIPDKLAMDPSLTVEIPELTGDTIEIVAHAGDYEVARHAWKYTWEDSSRALVLEDWVKPGAGAQGAGVGWKGVRLFKGSDGALYVQDKKGMATALLYLVPVTELDEAWSRWPARDTPKQR